MNSRWIAPAEWARLQQIIPIVCVDILPVKFHDATRTRFSVGLIHRDVLQGRRGWCLVGGRLLIGETLAEGLTRQLRDTLGPDIQFELPADPQPQFVAQYFPTPRAVGGIDLRQHAIALTFVLPIEGTPAAQGEAFSFDWFDPAQLPAPADFGFGQDRVLASCLSAFHP